MYENMKTVYPYMQNMEILSRCTRIGAINAAITAMPFGNFADSATYI